MSAQPPQAAPYEVCPVYESDLFQYRLVRPGDAQDLLACYSDPVANAFFNADNCHSSFFYSTVDDMRDCIRSWLEEYRLGRYVRFAVVEKRSGIAAGTLECFARPETVEGIGRIGILRIDLATQIETTEAIREILRMVDTHWFALFGVAGMLTKAIPAAAKRIAALDAEGYRPVRNSLVPFEHYYLKVR